MKKIKNHLMNLKDTLDKNISLNKQKIIGAVATVPLIATSAMTGVCAGGCPYGLINDPFPGQCSRYIDVNGDGICDLSQAVAATSTTGTGSTTSTSGDSSSGSSSSSGDSSGGINTQNDDHSNASAAAVHDPSSGVGDSDFHIIPVSILIIGIYFFTHYLFSKGILKPKKHKRMWNLLMLGSYLGTGITGLLLVYMINWGVLLAYRYGLAYWHAELALLMTIVTIIHFHIYRKPFKKMFMVLFRPLINKNKPKTEDTSK